jgi:tRNA 2-thiouridine synthesizing protein A
MTIITLDLTGLKCPLPALRTRKALAALPPGARLEVHCTDPLAVIDIPALVQQSGGRIEIVKQDAESIVFLIDRTDPVVATQQV